MSEPLREPSQEADQTSPKRPVWQLVVPAIVVVVGVLLAYLAAGRPGPAEDRAQPLSPAGDTVRTEQQQPRKPSDQQVEEAARRLDERFTRRREGDPFALGRVDAKVVLVEYADYRCPYCAKFSTDTRPELIKRYVDSGVLRIEWRDLPMFGEQSEAAAIAARAAARQGRFWPFHELAFAEAPRQGHAEYSAERLRDLARRAGVPDLARFDRDVADPALAQEMRVDAAEAQEMGLTSTPSFLVNGRAVVGAQPAETFHRMIEALAAK
ncbi:protein-disulfide isomerase [Crossiella equi]|uniref:Protein-disulfide isomerase n=1 Tax=Crossiella equi TaxID=130796 RepID=A0ABS5ABH0_9PSEU|nr:thioredoxin domain-containing protein [Crossiella equi]MBP2473924.1 protein-disulfide isomerase [Crossiella equi]